MCGVDKTLVSNRLNLAIHVVGYISEYSFKIRANIFKINCDIDKILSVIAGTYQGCRLIGILRRF